MLNTENINRKTILQGLLVLILIVGLIIGVLVVQGRVLFRPKATIGPQTLNYSLGQGWNYIGLPFVLANPPSPANLLALTSFTGASGAGHCEAVAEYLPPSGTTTGGYKFYYGDNRPNPSPPVLLEQISGGHNYFVWCSQPATLTLSDTGLGWSQLINMIDSLAVSHTSGSNTTYNYFFMPLPYKEDGTTAATASVFLNEAATQLSQAGKAAACVRLYRFANSAWEWYQQNQTDSIDFPIDRTKGHVLACTLPPPTPTPTPVSVPPTSTPTPSQAPSSWRFIDSFSGARSTGSPTDPNRLDYFSYHSDRAVGTTLRGNYMDAVWDGGNSQWRYGGSENYESNFHIKSNELAPGYSTIPVVRWIAPRPGQLTISGSFQRPSNQPAGNGTYEVVWSIKKKIGSDTPSVLWTYSTPSNSAETSPKDFSITSVSINANEMIEFWVDGGTDGGEDYTRTDFTISYYTPSPTPTLIPTNTPTPSPTITPTPTPIVFSLPAQLIESADGQGQNGWYYYYLPRDWTNSTDGSAYNVTATLPAVFQLTRQAFWAGNTPAWTCCNSNVQTWLHMDKRYIGPDRYEDVVIFWKAPSAGTANMSVKFRKVDQRGDGMTVGLYKAPNSVGSLPVTFSSTPRQEIDITGSDNSDKTGNLTAVSLQQDEALVFYVNAKGGNLGDILIPTQNNPLITVTFTPSQ